MLIPHPTVYGEYVEVSSNPNLTGSELVRQLEEWQQEIITLADVIRPYKEPRGERARCVAIAITKLDEARMWLAEAAMEEPR